MISSLLAHLIFSVQTVASTPPLIRSDYKPGELTQLCTENTTRTKNRLDQLVKDSRKGSRALLDFETIMADFEEEANTLVLMNSVSTNEKISIEGAQCKIASEQLEVATSSRRDLYKLLIASKPKTKDQKRLKFKTLQAFELAGMKLSDDKLAEVKELKARLAELETKFNAAVNADLSTVSFSEKELAAVPTDILKQFKKDGEGRYIVPTKPPDVRSILSNASASETRRRMNEAYYERGGDGNLMLLSQAVEIRGKIAKLIGFKNWADLKTSTRMAKNSTTVLAFLKNLEKKLAIQNEKDLLAFRKLKQELVPSEISLNSWDVPYLENQMKNRNFSVDTEKVREYFPIDVVMPGMFGVYSDLLGITIDQVPQATVWAPGVLLYAVKDRKSNSLLGYFFTDLESRPGKFAHVATSNLRPHRLLENGTVRIPISVIKANFSSGTLEHPTLMKQAELEVLFHEFGHVMHNLLTTAPYASLAGTNVVWDFVEAPSQMMENWVWSPAILTRISGHYKNHEEKIPSELVMKMLATRDLNQGFWYTRDVMYALYDMHLHTQNDLINVNELFKIDFRDITHLETCEKCKAPASWWHPMGGYDAAYYAYLWSQVYAQDMFAKFPEGQLTDSAIGKRYRDIILANGDMEDADLLIQRFLGRKPNSDAFLKRLHIQ